MIFELSNIQ